MLHKFTGYLLALFMMQALCGCSFVSEFFNGGEQIARIGKSVLYREDLQRVLPQGLTKEDSIRFTGRFINSWALDELMVLQAEKQLPKGDKNVEELVNEYRKQLLIYRYENRYVDQKLDTVIVRREIEEYYQNRKETFVSTDGVIKGLFIQMHKSSPALQKVIALAREGNDEENEELESFIYNTAYRYDHYQKNWMDLRIVARDMDMDIKQLQNEISKGVGVIQKQDSVYIQIFKIDGYVKGGEVTPLDYNVKRIKELILSDRKQELLEALHTNIVRDALNSKTLKIIDDDEN